jgi:hypothetical protein
MDGRSQSQEAVVRSRMRRQWKLVGGVLLTVAALGACSSGSSSGEAQAPRRTDPDPAPATTVATTIPDTATTTPRRSTSTTRLPAGTATTVPRRPAAYPGIYPEAAWEALDATEVAFAEGHQPWRGSPVDVARLYLDDQLALTDAGSLAASGPEGLVVTYLAGGVPGTVHLARPAGAVAVVVASDTDRLEGVRVFRSGDQIRVDVTSAAPGTVRAMAGGFQSEWTVDQAEEVSAGASVQFTLDTGLGDAPMLLRLRHEGTDGAVAVAERRVN